MKVSGSSIAAYYVGNAALALDRQAAQQSQAVAQQLQHPSRLPPLNEKVLEGELLNEERQRQAQYQSGAADDESAAQQRAAQPPLANTLSTNPAIRHYQTTAQLDGFASAGPIHQVDIYV